MDTQIEHKKRFTPKQIYGGVGVVLLIVLILYLFFRDTSSSMTVEKNRITIATIKEGEFNDYIRVIGQVLPSRMIYLDAIEGGRVEVWGIERSGFFNGREKWAKGFENQRV